MVMNACAGNGIFAFIFPSARQATNDEREGISVAFNWRRSAKTRKGDSSDVSDNSFQIALQEHQHGCLCSTHGSGSLYPLE
ncbi:hypothetical protein ABC383_17495 [Noviherbaspirillum sp. 1P10PC]|uniref:hypothetical protein n=1 Tax=Noviherbaspirillum sp. 1P10PC TaxID=3132292 RepID=UPI00399F034F